MHIHKFDSRLQNGMVERLTNDVKMYFKARKGAYMHESE